MTAIRKLKPSSKDSTLIPFPTPQNTKTSSQTPKDKPPIVPSPCGGWDDVDGCWLQSCPEDSLMKDILDSRDKAWRGPKT